MTEILEGQVGLYDQDTWSGKMCLEPCLLETQKEKTSESSSKKLQGSSKKMPLFLSLQKRDGIIQDAYWETGGRLLGEYTMHSFGEFPREENASHLSQILEDCPHQKYYLSEKACEGILKRAERRGKALPPILDLALRKQANLLSVSKNERGDQGGGKGILIQGERVGALSTLNNQRVCAFEPGVASRVGGHVYEDDVAGTVRANAGDNQQAIVCGILEKKEPIMIEMTSTKNTVIKDGVSTTLTARMGTGGNQVNCVMLRKE